MLQIQWNKTHEIFSKCSHQGTNIEPIGLMCNDMGSSFIV